VQPYRVFWKQPATIVSGMSAMAEGALWLRHGDQSARDCRCQNWCAWWRLVEWRCVYNIMRSEQRMGSKRGNPSGRISDVSGYAVADEGCQSGRSLGRPSLVNPIRAGQLSPSAPRCAEIFSEANRRWSKTSGPFPRPLPSCCQGRRPTWRRQSMGDKRRMQEEDCGETTRNHVLSGLFGRSAPAFALKSTGHPGHAFLRSATRRNARHDALGRSQGRTSRARSCGGPQQATWQSIFALLEHTCLPCARIAGRPKVMELAVAVANWHDFFDCSFVSQQLCETMFLFHYPISPDSFNMRFAIACQAGGFRRSIYPTNSRRNLESCGSVVVDRSRPNILWPFHWFHRAAYTKAEIRSASLGQLRKTVAKFWT
jgi:hypothetical protein